MQSVVSRSSPYRLADHVHACHFDEQVVLLDTRRNKYLGVDSHAILTHRFRPILTHPCSSLSGSGCG